MSRPFIVEQGASLRIIAMLGVHGKTVSSTKNENSGISAA